MLKGWKAAVYLACDRAQTLRSLGELPDLDRDGVGEEELRAFLDRCVDHELMVHDGRSWVGVAVHRPARERAVERERAMAAASIARRTLAIDTPSH